jgi:hypothetical protein
MDKKELITYCGLYCGLCSLYTRIPNQAKELKDSYVKEHCEQWGKFIPGFEEFWTFLNKIIDESSKCYCKKDNCGPPFCGVRKCAKGKGIEICVECDEYPCNRIHLLAKGYPALLSDGKRLKEIGIKKWIEEQEKRKKTGFAYVDIRCYPYEVPDK